MMKKVQIEKTNKKYKLLLAISFVFVISGMMLVIPGIMTESYTHILIAAVVTLAGVVGIIVGKAISRWDHG